MIYELDKNDLNKSINNLYYVEGLIAGLTNLEPFPYNIRSQIQDVINMLTNMRDCEVHVQEGTPLPKSTDELLDTIRAELHATAEMHDDGCYYLHDRWIDEIFDAYTKEGEDNV